MQHITRKRCRESGASSRRSCSKTAALAGPLGIAYVPVGAAIVSVRRFQQAPQSIVAQHFEFEFGYGTAKKLDGEWPSAADLLKNQRFCDYGAASNCAATPSQVSFAIIGPLIRLVPDPSNARCHADRCIRTRMRYKGHYRAMAGYPLSAHSASQSSLLRSLRQRPSELN